MTYQEFLRTKGEVRDLIKNKCLRSGAFMKTQELANVLEVSPRTVTKWNSMLPAWRSNHPSLPSKENLEKIRFLAKLSDALHEERSKVSV